ncbi:hypothetical protein ACEPAH_9022 [Sanghuangporus vaninii]
MTAEKDQLPPIEPLHERWEPNPVPANIEVPGLDTSAPVQDQIEQIEQLITIKLQNIDANFARAHQILSTRILPAVKRYAVNTEPVREAARFWVSFYEQAAQVRIPTTEDFSTEREGQATASDEEVETEQPYEGQQQPGTFDPNVTPAESSFAPENAAVSSTPMPVANERAPVESSHAHDMWAESMQSPLKRLNEGLKSLGEQEDSIIDHSKHSNSVAQQSMRSDASSIRRPVFTVPEKGKSKVPPTLLQNVLSKNVRGAEKERQASPVKMRKTPKKNPYVPPDVRRADWDGIVDLRNPATPRRAPGSSADWSSEEEDFPPPGVSPPRSAFGKRIAAQIGRTPVREAAALIGRDLVGDAERFQPKLRFDVPNDHSLTGTMSTPSITMFSKHAMGVGSSDRSSSAGQAHGSTSHTSTSDVPPSIEDIMQRFKMERGPEHGARDNNFDSFDDTPGRPVFPHLTALPDDGMGDFNEADSSFDDSFDDMYDGPPPAMTFIPNAQQIQDDSFGSDNSFDDGAQGGQPIHPFAFNAMPVDDSFDDSFNYDDRGAHEDEEPTIFGMQHAQRFAGGAGHLQLHGQGLVDDTTALNSHLRRNVDPETPTPWVGGPQGGAQ